MKITGYIDRMQDFGDGFIADLSTCDLPDRVGVFWQYNNLVGQATVSWGDATDSLKVEADVLDEFAANPKFQPALGFGCGSSTSLVALALGVPEPHEK